MEQQPRLPLWFLLVNCGLIAIAFIVGAMIGGRQRTDFPQPQSDALRVIYRQILESHVEPQNGAELLDRAIDAMAGKLDDYSRYVPPSEVVRYEENSTGRYEGIGLVMGQHGEDIVVHVPFAGGPADRAGIRPGDKLVAIDGRPVADLPVETRNTSATELVRGPADTPVVLRFDRDGTSLEFRVARAAVQRPAVKWAHVADLDHRLGYLQITDFHRGIADGVREAILELEREGALHGLVIDLRWNGGGNLDECVALARLFQPTGVIVSTRRRGAELERLEAIAADCRYPALPLAVLVNGDSASASEVFAGCLQDHGRATVVGTRTYGKGVVNTVYSWADFKLKLTTAYYYTPNGRSLGGSHRSEDGTNGTDKIGIAPDVDVPMSDEERRAALQVLFQQEVPAAHLAAYRVIAERYSLPVPQPPQAADDKQLDAALQALLKRTDPTNGK